MVNIELFGKHHWSLMAYLGHLTVNKLNIDRRKMRCNENKHPLLSGKPIYMTWIDSHSTVLKDSSIVNGHDDWDCLNDLEDHGFVEVISLVNCVFLLTEKGADCVKQLTLHKQDGKKYNDFIFTEHGELLCQTQ